MKFRAILECPQGQQPGDIFEAEEDAGAVLELVGAAERVTDAEAARPPKPKGKGKGTYARRDLVAEDR